MFFFLLVGTQEVTLYVNSGLILILILSFVATLTWVVKRLTFLQRQTAAFLIPVANGGPSIIEMRTLPRDQDFFTL